MVVVDQEEFVAALESHSERINSQGAFADGIDDAPELVIENTTLLSIDLASNSIPVNQVKFVGVEFLDVLFGREARRSSFQDCSFIESKLVKSRMDESDFQGVKFDQCSLLHADFSRCSVVDTSFVGCDLTKARFDQVVLESVSFENCRFDRTLMAPSSWRDLTVSGKPSVWLRSDTPDLTELRTLLSNLEVRFEPG